mmetsp:Transcript_57419/g.133851  ORF Transcript_57419/g.133851 Transcript_57419/m.133851 type:complete len:119 (+) Transcript_57419:46-402(+)
MGCSTSKAGKGVAPLLPKDDVEGPPARFPMDEEKEELAMDTKESNAERSSCVVEDAEAAAAPAALGSHLPQQPLAAQAVRPKVNRSKVSGKSKKRGKAFCCYCWLSGGGRRKPPREYV